MSDADMAKKIKVLRLNQGLTLEQVGNMVGVGKSTVRKWETGAIANMKRDKIAALANALQCSPAYLMGWEEEISSSAPISVISKGKKIKLLREAIGMSQTELAKQTNSSKQTIYKYENDIITNIPSDKIAALANALQCSPAYLMGWEEEPTAPTSVSTFSLPEEIQKQYGEDASHAFSLYLRLDDMDKGKIIGRMETFLEDGKYKKILSKNA